MEDKCGDVLVPFVPWNGNKTSRHESAGHLERQSSKFAHHLENGKLRVAFPTLYGKSRELESETPHCKKKEKTKVESRNG